MAFRLRVLFPCWLILLTGLVVKRRGISVAGSVRPLLPPEWILEPGSLFGIRFGFDGTREAISHPLLEVTHAALALLSQQTSASAALVVLLVHLLLVSIVAVAAGRSTAAEFCIQERIGGISSLRFSVQHLPRALLSLIIAGGLILALHLPLVIAEWFADPPGPLSGIVMLLWIPLCAAAALVVLGILVCSSGWLMSLAAISTDRCDGADALSRGINYVLSHPTRITCYLVIVTVNSLLAGWLGGQLVSCIRTVLQCWLPDLLKLAEQQRGIGTFEEFLVGSHWLSLTLLPAAVQLGAFFSGVTLVYLVLRQREDAVDLREWKR